MNAMPINRGNGTVIALISEKGNKINPFGIFVLNPLEGTFSRLANVTLQGNERLTFQNIALDLFSETLFFQKMNPLEKNVSSMTGVKVTKEQTSSCNLNVGIFALSWKYEPWIFVFGGELFDSFQTWIGTVNMKDCSFQFQYNLPEANSMVLGLIAYHPLQNGIAFFIRNTTGVFLQLVVEKNIQTEQQMQVSPQSLDYDIFHGCLVFSYFHPLAKVFGIARAFIVNNAFVLFFSVQYTADASTLIGMYSSNVGGGLASAELTFSDDLMFARENGQETIIGRNSLTDTWTFKHQVPGTVMKYFFLPFFPTVQTFAPHFFYLKQVQVLTVHVVKGTLINSLLARCLLESGDHSFYFVPDILDVETLQCPVPLVTGTYNVSLSNDGLHFGSSMIQITVFDVQETLHGNTFIRNNQVQPYRLVTVPLGLCLSFSWLETWFVPIQFSTPASFLAVLLDISGDFTFHLQMKLCHEDISFQHEVTLHVKEQLWVSNGAAVTLGEWNPLSASILLPTLQPLSTVTTATCLITHRPFVGESMSASFPISFVQATQIAVPLAMKKLGKLEISFFDFSSPLFASSLFELDIVPTITSSPLYLKKDVSTLVELTLDGAVPFPLLLGPFHIPANVMVYSTNVTLTEMGINSFASRDASISLLVCDFPQWEVIPVHPEALSTVEIVFISDHTPQYLNHEQILSPLVQVQPRTFRLEIPSVPAGQFQFQLQGSQACFASSPMSLDFSFFVKQSTMHLSSSFLVSASGFIESMVITLPSVSSLHAQVELCGTTQTIFFNNTDQINFAHPCPRLGPNALRVSTDDDNFADFSLDVLTRGLLTIKTLPPFLHATIRNITFQFSANVPLDLAVTVEGPVTTSGDCILTLNSTSCQLSVSLLTPGNASIIFPLSLYFEKTIFVFQIEKNPLVICAPGQELCADMETCVTDWLRCPNVFVAMLDRIYPEIVPQLGGWVTLSGRKFLSPLAITLSNVPVTNISFVAAPQRRALQVGNVWDGQLVFFTPVFATSQYVDISLVQCEKVESKLSHVLFVSDDCPVAGSFGKGTDCKPCPKGGVCPGGNRIYPLPGYWNAGETSGFVSPCSSTERCLGGPLSSCGVGYMGDYCALCAPSFYADGDSCTSCNLKKATGVVALVAVTFIFFFFVVVFVGAILFASDSKLSNVAMILITIQVIQSVGVTASTRLPTFLKTMFSILRLMSMDFSFIRTECTNTAFHMSPFTLKYVGTLGLFFTILVTVWLCIPLIQGFWRLRIYFYPRLNAKYQKIKLFYRYRKIRGTLLVMTIFYSALTARALASFDCHRQNGSWYLASEKSTRCFAGPHIGLLITSLFIFAVISLGFPLALIVGFEKNQKRLWDYTLIAPFGYFYEAMKPQFYRASTARLWISLVLAFSSTVLSSAPRIKLALTAPPLGLFMLFLIFKRPFKVMWKNLALVFSLFASFCALFTDYFIATSQGTLTLIFSLAALIATCSLCLLFLVILGLYLKERASQHAQQDDVIKVPHPDEILAQKMMLWRELAACIEAFISVFEIERMMDSPQLISVPIAKASDAIVEQLQFLHPSQKLQVKEYVQLTLWIRYFSFLPEFVSSPSDLSADFETSEIFF
jgi:hypothetical protein